MNANQKRIILGGGIMKVKMIINSNELKIGYPYLIYWDGEEYIGCIAHIDDDGVEINTFDSNGTPLTRYFAKGEVVTFEPLMSPLPHVPDEAEKDQLIKDAKRKFIKPAFKGPIIKFINSNNHDKNYLKDTYEYIAAPSKTDNGRLVTTYGCVSDKDPVAWMITVKRAWQKTNGKQGEHFIVSFPEDFDKTPNDLLEIMREIVEANFHGYSAVIAVHLDAIHLHSHVLLNSVSWENGMKFSQSPSDLNKLKLKINEILNNHGINIIRDSVNHMRITSETNEIPEGE